MSTSIFEQVMSSFTVRSICSSLGPDIPEGTCLAELESLLDPSEDRNLDPWHNPSRVVDPNGDLVGILWFEDWAFIDDNEIGPDLFTVDDVMDHPKPWQLMSSSTPILEAIDLFATRSNHLFYVIHGNQVVGFLGHDDLFHPAGRLVLLSLALEIEDQALRLCQHVPLREATWNSLADTRKSKAIEIFKQNNGREPQLARDIDRLLDCTQLKDKATMIWKGRLLPTVASGARLSRFFEELRKIRDFCAHPQRSQNHLMSMQELSHFLKEAEYVRNELNQSFVIHKVPIEHQILNTPIL